jgi:RPA family protein
MRVLVLLALLVARDPERIFHNETVDSLHASRHTHVRIVGTVTLVKREADGDVHFRVSDAHGHFVVCEMVPYHVLARPRLGQAVVVEGIHRYDNEAGHGWDEVHPVERWTEAVK